MIKVNRFDVILPKTTDVLFLGITNISTISNIYRPRVDDGIYGNWISSQSVRTWSQEITVNGDWIGDLQNPPLNNRNINDVYFNTTDNTYYKHDGVQWFEAIRGPFRDFPESSIAIADLDTNNVYIYDISGNEPIIWMIFKPNINSFIKDSKITSLNFLGGNLVIGQEANGLTVIDFFKEESWNYTTAGLFKNTNEGLANRNENVLNSWVLIDPAIQLITNDILNIFLTISNNTVFKNQALAPTIYAGTDIGYFKLDTLNNLSFYNYTWTPNVPVNYISGDKAFSSQLHGDFLSGLGTGLVIIHEDELSETVVNDFTITSNEYHDLTIPKIGFALDEFTSLLTTSPTTHYIGFNNKLVIVEEFEADLTKTLVSIITSTYSTPFMLGDVDLCLDGDLLVDRSFFVNTTITDNGSVLTSIVNSGTLKYNTASAGSITITVDAAGDIYGWELDGGQWKFRKTISEWTGITKIGTLITIQDGTSFTRLVHTKVIPDPTQLVTIEESDTQLFNLKANTLLAGVSDQVITVSYDKNVKHVYVSTLTDISVFSGLFNIKEYNETSQFISVNNDILIKG